MNSNQLYACLPTKQFLLPVFVVVNNYFIYVHTFYTVVFAVTVNQGRAFVTTTLKSSARLRMGGSCTLFGGCQIIKPDVSTEN